MCCEASETLARTFGNLTAGDGLSLQNRSGGFVHRCRDPSASRQGAPLRMTEGGNAWAPACWGILDLRSRSIRESTLRRMGSCLHHNAVQQTSGKGAPRSSPPTWAQCGFAEVRTDSGSCRWAVSESLRNDPPFAVSRKGRGFLN